jgi:hypothetical protein
LGREKKYSAKKIGYRPDRKTLNGTRTKNCSIYILEVADNIAPGTVFFAIVQIFEKNMIEIFFISEETDLITHEIFSKNSLFVFISEEMEIITWEITSKNHFSDLIS